MQKITGIFTLLLLVTSAVLGMDRPCADAQPKETGIMAWWTTAGATAGATLGAGLGVQCAYTSLKDIIRIPRLADIELLKSSVKETTGSTLAASIVAPVAVVGGLAVAGAIGGGAVGAIGRCASQGKDTLSKDLDKNGFGGWGGAFITGITVATIIGGASIYYR